jgi:xanthine dehydrogenase accessory factor
LRRGIDLLFTPCRDARSIVAVLGALARREPMALALGVAGAAPAVADAPAGWSADAFVQHYVPPLRLVAVGQGEDLAALARLAMAFGIEVVAHAPERDPLMREAAGAMAVHPMASRTAEVAFASDAWTAIVFLFHDHDWEEACCRARWPRRPSTTARSAAGGHTARGWTCCARQACRIADRCLARLDRPDPSTRDPATLALSILGEVVQDYQACAGGAEWTTARAQPPPRPDRRAAWLNRIFRG